MLDITLLALMALGPRAEAAQVTVTLKPVILAPAEFDQWLAARPERLEDWIGLQPRELTRALGTFGADAASVAKLEQALAGKTHVVAQAYVLGLFRRAWVEPRALESELSTETLHAIYRYLMATHGVPRRTFATRAEAQGYVAEITPNLSDRPIVQDNIVEFQGQYHLVLTYDIWSKLGSAAHPHLTVPIWDQSTRAHLGAGLAVESNEDLGRVARDFAAGRDAAELEREFRRQLTSNAKDGFTIPIDQILSRPARPGRVNVGPGSSLHFGDRLVYVDAEGHELHESTFVADGIVTADQGRTFARREQDEFDHVHTSRYRLTVERPTPGVMSAPLSLVAFENHVPAPALGRAFVERCMDLFRF
jgi:hypothetical protein